VGEIAIPYVFAALMALEFAYNMLRRTGFQDARDSAVSLMVAIPHFALLSIVPVAWFVVYCWLEPRIPGSLPISAWWIWPLGIVVMDFAAYWMHRYHHALNLTWAVHSVHHSSTEMTITTGGRSSLAEPVINLVTGAYAFLIAPALLGIPAAAAGLGWLVKDTWGFAVHTRNVGKLGVLEYVLATPSHHRVHHAVNAIYAGKNYGFVFIVWDKLFGTFQPELHDVEAVYGTADPPASYQPLRVAFHGLAQLWWDAVATRRWRDKARLWFMPAGWRPADVAPRTQRPWSRGAPPVSLYVVGVLQLVLLLGCVAHLAITIATHGLAPNAAYLAFIVLGTAVAGELYERSSRYSALECARALVLFLSVAVTGTWFGRALDLSALLLAFLAIANLGASLVHGRTDTRTGRRPSGRHAPRVRGDVVRVLSGGAADDRARARRASARASHQDRGR
jgi:alkylglycerol monooxygenase